MKKVRRISLQSCDFVKVLMMLLVVITHVVAVWDRDGWFNQRASSSSEILSFIGALFG